MTTDKHQPAYTIGQAASMANTTVKTLHYYDDIGLLRPSKRTEGGHRLYSAADLWTLELIGTLRYVNFSLADIGKMISGDLSMTEALNLQIDVLEVELGAISSMLTILKQARQPTKHISSKDSMQYIADLVASRSVHTVNRQQFIDHKMEETRLLETLPEDWQASFMHFFNKYIMKASKLTARQTQAWTELQKLLNDPAYIKELAHSELPFFRMALHPGHEPGEWIRQMEQIRLRTQEAIQQQWAASSQAVQALTRDFLLLYANVEELEQPEEFLPRQAQHLLDSVTERTLRFNKLCTLVNPEWQEISSGMELLMQGMQELLARNSS